MTERLAAAPPTAERCWPPEQGDWTYDDWLRLPDDGYRYEVIDGVLHMTPPPAIGHQRASHRLDVAMSNFVEAHRLGEVFSAPTGVRLPGQPVPVQPDIFFVSAERRDIIAEDYVEGAPDLVVEILSPGNWLYDRKEKMEAYAAAGVPEYWIVDHRTRSIEVFQLEGETFALLGKFEAGAVARSRSLAGFEVRVDEVLAG